MVAYYQVFLTKVQILEHYGGKKVFGQLEPMFSLAAENQDSAQDATTIKLNAPSCHQEEP